MKITANRIVEIVEVILLIDAVWTIVQGELSHAALLVITVLLLQIGREYLKKRT